MSTILAASRSGFGLMLLTLHLLLDTMAPLEAVPAQLVVAHNAAFDRRFLERFSDVFVTKPWACSMSEVNWAAEGYEWTKLAYLAMGAGFFYDRQRAENDCRAAIALLAGEQPRSGRTALAQLLERARTPQWRIWADSSGALTMADTPRMNQQSSRTSKVRKVIAAGRDAHSLTGRRRDL